MQAELWAPVGPARTFPGPVLRTGSPSVPGRPGQLSSCHHPQRKDPQLPGSQQGLCPRSCRSKPFTAISERQGDEKETNLLGLPCFHAGGRALSVGTAPLLLSLAAELAFFFLSRYCSPCYPSYQKWGPGAISRGTNTSAGPHWPSCRPCLVSCT